MMKQPFTKFGVTTLFSLLCSAFLHAQVVTDERMFSFEEPQIPDCITATHSRLSVSDLHYKDGKHSLEWTFEPGGILELKKDLKFEKKDPTGKDLYLSAFIVWVYNEVPQDATIEFQFLKDGKRCTSFPFGINFSGWRAAWVCYERDMQGTPEEGMNELRIIAPNSKGSLFIDHLITATKVDARQQTADLQVPFVNAGTTNHWLVVYQHSLLKPDIELTPVDDKQRAEMQLLEKRFRDMIYTKGKTTDKEVETIRKKYDFYQITYKNGQVSGVPIYMVRASEAYERIIPNWDKDMLTKMGVEMRAYFDLMKRIAVAYNNAANPVIREEMKKKFLAMYDHITDQGVAYGSCWGNIHHYGYSVRGLYLAYFLMKDVLRETGKLQEAERTLRWYAITNEAFRLDASLAICMMLDALRFLSDENNKIARAQLAVAYQNEVLQKGLDWNTLLLLPAENYLPAAFLEKTKELRLMPLYELLEELFSIFEMNLIKDQDAYLFAFFDAVTDYLQSNSSELDGFIRYWDETLCSKTIPSGEVEGIRIFSIHKSKGLEFHTVLLPFCDWKLENETNNQLVWCAPQTAPFNTLDILPINYSTQMAESIYGNDYLQERLQLWVDNLNLLYVAFTRAGKNLIIWSRKSQKGTMSELLANTLPIVAQEEGIDWEEDCYEQGQLCPSEKERIKTSTNKLTQKPEKLPIRMESMRHDIEFRQSNRSADFIQGIEEEDSDDRFINRGRMLHTLFSVIETAEDIDPAIERLIFEGVIRNDEKEKVAREVAKKAFSSPEIQDWYSGKWTLFNECAIIYKEKGVLQTRRPDRVMMKDDQVVVVDFKFGKENPKYNKQVKGYMQLLTKMGYKNITGYLWYVDEEKIEKV